MILPVIYMPYDLIKPNIGDIIIIILKIIILKAAEKLIKRR